MFEKVNPAHPDKLGFKTVDENAEEYIMVCE